MLVLDVMLRMTVSKHLVDGKIAAEIENSGQAAIAGAIPVEALVAVEALVGVLVEPAIAVEAANAAALASALFDVEIDLVVLVVVAAFEVALAVMAFVKWEVDACRRNGFQSIPASTAVLLLHI